jgi:cell wall-associated NlpC family hydrolase
MFTRWAFAQAGIDIGLTTVQQWPANGLLPDTETASQNLFVLRGVGSEPPAGGYQPADLIFFGHGSGGEGHVALWLGEGLIAQCSASGNGSNIRPLAGYVAPTGWVRWKLTTSG